jgi:hypothetical protein
MQPSALRPRADDTGEVGGQVAAIVGAALVNIHQLPKIFRVEFVGLLAAS